MLQILGKEAIYVLPPRLEHITDMSEIPAFPSPLDLMYKYVIKGKCPRRLPQAILNSDLNITPAMTESV